MGGRDRVAEMPTARCMDAALVAEEGLAPRLVDGDPVRDEVAEHVDRAGCELREPQGGVTAGPAARVLEDLGQLPVVERDERSDAGLPEAFEQRTVERDALRVQSAAAVRLQTRPRDGQPVGGEAQVGHQRHVLGPAMVVVAGHVAGVAAGRLAGRVGEGVPDGRASAVLVHARPRSDRRRWPRPRRSPRGSWPRPVPRRQRSASLAWGCHVSFTPRSPRAGVRWGLLCSA